MFYESENMREQQTDRLRLRFAIAILIASAAIPLSISALATSAQKTKRPNPRISRPRLVELRSVDQLRELFQRDSGKVRLVALVSPT